MPRPIPPAARSKIVSVIGTLSPPGPGSGPVSGGSVVCPAKSRGSIKKMIDTINFLIRIFVY